MQISLHHESLGPKSSIPRGFSSKTYQNLRAVYISWRYLHGVQIKLSRPFRTKDYKKYFGVGKDNKYLRELIEQAQMYVLNNKVRIIIIFYCRYLGFMKAQVWNQACPEGSLVNHLTACERYTFASRYLHGVSRSIVLPELKITKNILELEKIKISKRIIEQTHMYVLSNKVCIEPYLKWAQNFIFIVNKVIFSSYNIYIIGFRWNFLSVYM